MKGKLVTVLIVIVSAVLLGSTLVFSKGNSQTNNANKDLNNETPVARNLNIDSSSKNNNIEDDATINFEGINGEQIYNIFKGPNANEIIGLLDRFNNDSDRVVVTSDGEILNGQIDLINNDSEKIMIDTATDSKGITVHDLKALIEVHKDEINELADKNN